MRSAPRFALVSALCLSVLSGCSSCDEKKPEHASSPVAAPSDPVDAAKKAAEEELERKRAAQKMQAEMVMRATGSEPDEATSGIEVTVRTVGEAGPRATEVGVSLKNPGDRPISLARFAGVSLISTEGQKVPPSSPSPVTLQPKGEASVSFVFPLELAKAQSVEIFGKPHALAAVPRGSQPRDTLPERIH